HPFLHSFPTRRSSDLNLVPSNLVKGNASNCSALIFGNFSDLFVGMWDGFEFIVDPFTAKRKGQIEVTANTFYDIKVARAASFAGDRKSTRLNSSHVKI